MQLIDKKRSKPINRNRQPTYHREKEHINIQAAIGSVPIRGIKCKSDENKYYNAGTAKRFNQISWMF